ncbi:MAG: DUF1206 domain-containing protein [Halomonas sp.]|nr:DUF1206 domain-containing protein [Halomonas sp.]
MKHVTPALQRGISAAARWGYMAKGVVYVLVGGLSLMTIAGLGGQRAGPKEAITQLATQPFGSFMLGLLGIGLFAYALWRLIQAWFDTEDAGSGVKGIATRLAFMISGIIHAGLGSYCFDLLNRSASSGKSPQGQTAELMSYPGGIYLVFAIGIVFLGVGLRQLVRAIKRSYLKNWHMREMNESQRQLAEGATRMGLTARGIVFSIIGVFLCIAAWQADPSEAQGLDGALNALARQPFGQWLLGIVSLGLVAYGVYCFINARFRDVSA